MSPDFVAEPAPIRRGKTSKVDKAADVADTVKKRGIDPPLDKLTALQPFLALANGIQKSVVGGGWSPPTDVKGFADEGLGSDLVNGEWYVADTFAEIGSAQTLYQGLVGRSEARQGYQQADEDEAHYDSLTGNLAGSQLEEGITGMLVNPFNVFNDSFNIGGVGDANPAKHVIDSLVSGKTSIEDSVSAEKSRRQKHKAKHELDHMLPLEFRRRRLKDFAADFLGIARPSGRTGKPRTSDFARFRDTCVAFRLSTYPKEERAKLKDRVPDDIAKEVATRLLKHQKDFLDYLEAKKVKEFGFGTEYRKKAEKKVYGGQTEPGERHLATVKDKYRDYHDMRSLGKVASFAHRRKAETAATNAVGAVGSALVASGAGAKPGAALKILKTGYTKSKTWGKRGRRVHKLRKAKNAMGYGTKTKRGVGWGARQFFFGDIDKQYGSAKAALDPDSTTKNKGANIDLDETETAQTIRRLTKQCDRRIDDLLRCLISDNAQVCYRARQILHVIAETNLSGAFNKITDEDLERYRTLYWQAQGKDPAPPHAVLAPPRTEDERTADHAEFDRRSKVIRDIVTRQLKGIGG